MDRFLKYAYYLINQFPDEVKMKTVNGNEVIVNSKKNKNNEECIYIITSGQAVLQLQNKIGKNDFYSILTENKMIGIEKFLDGDEKIENLEYIVKAQTKVTYLIFDCQFFIDHMYIRPELYHSVLNEIIKQYLILVHSYGVMNESIIVRITNTLLELVLVLKLEPNKKGNVEFPDYINQKFVAKYSNASIGRTSMVFKKLESLGVIKRNPIRIVNFKTLKNIRQINSKVSLYNDRIDKLKISE